jgi:DNA-binding transcriptional MerR regulator
MSNNDDRSGPERSNVFRVEETDPASPPPRQDTILSIGNVARMFGVERLTLRYYEARGLIKRRNRVGRVRVYTWADCDRIGFITKARQAGLKLGAIVPLVRIAADAHGDHERGRKMCTELIDRLARRRRAIDEGLAELRHLHTVLCTKPIGQDDVAGR